MVYGACDYCGNAYHECECHRTIEFEVALPIDGGGEVRFDVRVVPQDGGGRNVVIGLVDEDGGGLLDAQRRRVLAQLWHEATGRDLYDYIEATINRLV